MRESGDIYDAFQLLLPFAGEAVVGGALESSRSKLTKAIKASAAFKDGVKRGLTWANFSPFVKALSSLSEDSYTVGGGLERITQYLLGENQISKAGVFPISRDSLPIVIQICMPSCSDRRLKKDVEYLGTLSNGIKVYSFRYLWEKVVRVGVMAQDLLEEASLRHAVCQMPSGFLGVHYASIGLRMATLEEWHSNGDASLGA